MGAFRTIIAGGIVAGAGAALRFISGIIFSTFGETSGPYVDYTTLMELGSTVLIGLGAIIVAVGVVQLLYSAWERRERAARADRGGERRDGRGDQRQQAGGERQRREPRRQDRSRSR